jgi:hypothetical protein
VDTVANVLCWGLVWLWLWNILCCTRHTHPSSHYTCNTTTGGRICYPGYEGAKQNCSINIDDCLSHPCLNGGTCQDGVLLYSCQCSSHFTGNHCETDIDDCSPEPCQNGGTCIDGLGNYQCICSEGYMGVNCTQDIGHCIEEPCKNGGTCTDGVLSYECSCPQGYTGLNCTGGIYFIFLH